MKNYDAIVVGGGMVGSAMALSLSLRNLNVAIVESNPQQIDLRDGQIDLRVSALSRASVDLLARLGAWDAIDPACVAPFRQMQVWDAAVPPYSADVLRFDSAELAAAELGFIVENRRVLNALQRRLQETGIDSFSPARPDQLISGEQDIAVRLADGRLVKGTLLIGADGAGSMIRQMAGIETQGWPYAQKALVTHINTARPHADTAWQRFLPDGPIALLPLYDGRSSVVWSTRTEHADELRDMSAEQLSVQLRQATDDVLGDIRADEVRATFPLQLLHAQSYVSKRLVLVGDAAHAIHPLAGQGVNLGFADVAALDHLIADAPPATIGDLGLLRRYERSQKSQNLLMMGSLDLLHRLFASDHPLLGRARQLGMSAFNRMTGLKHAVVRRAMGLS
ncbi:MAG: UbiH/UbiF/VisC/COQ6 family ubiquinone biosynthesis hydroxylase [Gammaproteobacteria bacterium]|nr:UbiH/UbiF/VisC/COQ6 family ubiquinone biosynthesis hydroxylase [Gammaproteobacteria bacterium]